VSAEDTAGADAMMAASSRDSRRKTGEDGVSKLIGVLLMAAAASAGAAEPAGMIKIANGAVTIERSGEKHPATPGARIEAG